MLYTKNIRTEAELDVVVCGGGFSGFAAAYAAAREGKRVALLERGTCLGGVGTAGMVNHILGQRFTDAAGDTHTCVAGLLEKLERTLLLRGGASDWRNTDRNLPPQGWYNVLGIGLVFEAEQMKLLLEEMLSDMGVRIFYLTDIVDVIREKNRVSGVLAHNKSGLFAVEGNVFVDATGDADVCRLAGLAAVKGDENGEMAAASLEMHLENVDLEELSAYMRRTDDRRFRSIIGRLKEAGEWPFPYDIFISVLMTREDVFMINTIRQVGIDGADGDSLTRGILSGRKENFALFETAKKHFPGFENAHIRQIAPMIGIRETVRIRGEYALSVDDLIFGRDFPDGIALSGYGWDLPHPKTPSLQPYDGVTRKSPITQIPYRCLVPVGVDNVLAAGRCISTEREALGPVRVMGPCIAMGEAAGIAAAQICGTGRALRDADTDALRRKIWQYGGLTDRAQVRKEEQ